MTIKYGLNIIFAFLNPILIILSKIRKGENIIDKKFKHAYNLFLWL